MSDSNRITRDGGGGRVRSILKHPLVVGLVTTVAAVLVPTVPEVFKRGTWSSVVGLAAVAAILSGLGLLARNRSRTKAWPFVLAVTLVTIGGASAGVVARTWVTGPPPSPGDALPAPTPSSASPSPASRVGLPVRRPGVRPRECFKLDNPDGKLPGTVGIVSCEEPHHIEAYFAGDPWGPEKPYPGSEQALDQAEKWCQGKVFTDYVGVAYGSSVLRTWVWIPGVKSWGAGDRRVVCFAYQRGKKPLRYSVEGLGG